MWTLLSLVGVLLLCLEPIDCGGRLSIVLKRYKNPRHLMENGDCCDKKPFGGCLNCDNYFEVCITDFDNPSSDRSCPIGRFQTGELGGDDLTMSHSEEFNFYAINGRVGLYVKVHDKDKWTDNDLVATLRGSTSVSPASSARNARTFPVRLTGTYATLEVEIRVYCDDGYFGSSCTTFCKAHDDIGGHYTCTKEGGRKCLPGWHGNYCTKYCVPKNSDKDGHYICDDHGNKICHTGWKLPDCKTCSQHWFGRGCSTPCVPQDHPTRGHYTCDEKDGSRNCMPWWHGERCDHHCVPHDDPVLGHYTCVAENGAKTCMENWHGENCTTFCAPQNNSINGHYRCDEDGNKVCLDGYNPPDCRECAPGRYGLGCSESCVRANSTRTDNIVCSEDGEQECRPWWHGDDCEVYCVPHDDSEHGHYQCGAHGEMECLKGWGGPSCRTGVEN